MNVDDARTFVAVVETGSISRAARDLHLTQPAVSRRVQRLEQAIGAPLIDRRRRPFALTDVGRAAVERCRRLLATSDELKALAQGGVFPSRELRIGVAHALTELALTEPVDAMRQQFPAVVVRLHTGWSRDLLGRVASGALDAAAILLFERDELPAGIAARALADEHLAIVAPRSWRKPTCGVRDLRDSGWILNPEGCAARAALERELARARLPLRVSVETYNYELQLRLVARGRGLGLAPSRLVQRSPMHAKLRALDVRGLSFPMKIWMVTGELAAPLELPVAALGRALAVQLARSAGGRRTSVRPEVRRAVPRARVGRA